MRVTCKRYLLLKESLREFYPSRSVLKKRKTFLCFSSFKISERSTFIFSIFDGYLRVTWWVKNFAMFSQTVANQWQWIRLNCIQKPEQFRGLKIPIISQSSFFPLLSFHLSLQDSRCFKTKWDLTAYTVKQTKHSQKPLPYDCWHCRASLPRPRAQLSRTHTHSQQLPSTHPL